MLKCSVDQVVAFLPPQGEEPALFKNRHADGELEDLEVSSCCLTAVPEADSVG